MRYSTLLLTPFAAAISSIARWMLFPIVGGASSTTTPSAVVEHPALQLAVGALDPARLGHAADLQRLEAGCADQAPGSGLRDVVVGGVEEDDPRVAVRAGCELLDGDRRAERLEVVRA